MKVDLVHVETADGVRLDGTLRTPAPRLDARLGLDLVICHHGVGGNFYNPYFFDDLGALLLKEGCGALRVNSRGHDLAFRGPRGKLGAECEIVDDCRLDWRAWLDFAESSGYRRIGVWGHSLGAVKTIYYQAVEQDPRVVCAVASSPPRFSYAAYLASAEGPRFKADMERAQQLVAAGHPEAIVEATLPLVTTFTARTYVDKYGPQSRYDIFARLQASATPPPAPGPPPSPAPLLVTVGELEIEGLAFRDLAARGPELQDAAPHVSYSLVTGADHSYATRVPELWRTFRGWLTEAGVAPATAGVSAST